MLMHHCWRVACLLRGLILVSMRGKVVGAKGVAQPVRLARHLGVFAELAELLLPDDFGAFASDRADLASSA